MFFFFFFKQKTAYEMRISDWSSDVCSSDLGACLDTRPSAALGMNEVGRARKCRPCSPARLPTTIDRRERPRHDWRLLDAGLRLCPSFEPRYAVASIYSQMSYYSLIDRKSAVKGRRVSDRVDTGGGLII